MERSQNKAQVTDVTAANLSSFKVMSYLTGTDDGYFGSEQTATKQMTPVEKIYSEEFHLPKRVSSDGPPRRSAGGLSL